VTCEVSKATTPVGLGEGEARARLLGWAMVRAQAVGRGVRVCVRCAVGCVKGFAQVRALATARPPQVLPAGVAQRRAHDPWGLAYKASLRACA